MMSRSLALAIAATVIVINVHLDRHAVFAQLIYQDATNNSLGASYFESHSVGGFLRGDNWFLNFGSGPSDPVRSSRGRASDGIRFNFSQGSLRTITSTSVGVTTMDGFPGSIQSGTIRPFVTGFTPVVSTFPQPVDTESVQNLRQLAKLRQSQNELRDQRLQTLLQRIHQAEASGNVRMAHANYRSAIAMTKGLLQRQLKQNMQAFLANVRRQAKRQN